MINAAGVYAFAIYGLPWVAFGILPYIGLLYLVQTISLPAGRLFRRMEAQRRLLAFVNTL